MNSIFIYITFILYASQAWAQMPFAHPNQLSVMQNPSLAGARNRVRLASSFNHAASTNRRESNLGLCYDQTLKKTGLGVGAYYQFSSQAYRRIEADWATYLPETKYVETSQFHRIGIALAPKYNIMSKKDPSKIRLSVSPSVFVEYQYKRNTIYDYFSKITYRETEYTSEHPNGLAQPDSSVGSYIKDAFANNVYKAGMALGIHAENIILLFKVSHETDRSSETVAKHDVNLSMPQHRIQSQSFNQTVYSIDESMYTGISFPKRRNTLLSLTPMVGLGFKQYLNVKRGAEAGSKVYNQNLKTRNNMDINMAHASAMLRIGKFITGTSYTQSNHKDYYGVSLGFQSSKMKLIYCVMLGNLVFNEFSLVLLL